MKKISFVLLGCFLLLPLYSEAAIYRWVDERGITHFTNDPEAVPKKEQEQGKVFVKKSENPAGNAPERTVVHFEKEGTTILVHGVVNYRLPVVFHLDTGATETLITPRDAASLGLDTKGAPRVTTALADGSRAFFPKIRLKSLSVGKAEVKNLDVLVGRVRLLGLSFLKNFKMTVDGEQGQLILEAPEYSAESESPEISAEKEHARGAYEAKLEKQRILRRQILKNIERVEAEIAALQARRAKYDELLETAPMGNRDEVENLLERVSLAVESYRLQVESYQKDLETVENNIAYYESWINQLK